jgi:hypothetical protein
MPKLTIAVALLVLIALAGTITYTSFLVVGVVADHLGLGRGSAGLLLGALFARFPWISKGKFRVVGLLPQPFRRPVIVSLLALCMVDFLSRGESVRAMASGVVLVFVVVYPWLKRAIVDRMRSSVFAFAGRNPRQKEHDEVIDGEFRELKD